MKGLLLLALVSFVPLTHAQDEDTQDLATETWQCQAVDEDALIKSFKINLEGELDDDYNFVVKKAEGSVTALSLLPEENPTLQESKLSFYDNGVGLKHFNKVTVIQAFSNFYDGFHNEEHEFVLMDTDEAAAELVTEINSGIGINRNLYKCDFEANY